MGRTKLFPAEDLLPDRSIPFLSQSRNRIRIPGSDPFPPLPDSGSSQKNTVPQSGNGPGRYLRSARCGR